jgi:folate-binding Fe-S cluster repair protein YgfZ
VIALSGRDAVAFAQAQLMNDVDATPVGRWQWSGWLTPKGRVIALFALVRVAEDAVWLVVADVDPDALATRLQRFVLRRQLQVEVRRDLHVTGQFAAPEHASGASFAGDVLHGIELDVSGFGIRRTLRIAREEAPQDVRPRCSGCRATCAWGSRACRLRKPSSGRRRCSRSSACMPTA